MTSIPSSNRKISIENMQKIAEMSEKNDRTEIAEEIGVTKQTIYKYQKLMRLM